MGNKATKFDTSNHHHHHGEEEQQREEEEGQHPGNLPRKQSTRSSRRSSLFRSATSINNHHTFDSQQSRITTKSSRGLPYSHSQPTLVRFKEDNLHNEILGGEDEGQDHETLKRKQPSSSDRRNNRHSILLFLGRNNNTNGNEKETSNNNNNTLIKYGEDDEEKNKIMDRSTELNDSFLRQMKRRTLNLGSALFNRKLVSNSNSPGFSSSNNKIQSPTTTIMNSSSVSVLVPAVLSDDDSDENIEANTPTRNQTNRLSFIMDNVPTVSSPNSSPTTNPNTTQTSNFESSFNNSTPNSKLMNSPGNRKSQLLLNLVMMNRKSVKNLESLDSSGVNSKLQTSLIESNCTFNEMTKTPPSPSGSSSTSSTSVTSIKMSFSHHEHSHNKTPSPTPLHSTTSSSNLTRQHSSSRRKSIGAFVFEPLRFNKQLSQRSISPNTKIVNSPTVKNINPSPATNHGNTMYGNNLLSVNNNFGGSNSALTPTTPLSHSYEYSPISSPRSPRSPIDRTLGESRVELRKKVFSVRLENREGSNSSLVSLAFPGKGIDETVVRNEETDHNNEIDHTNLIEYKFHFLFSMSTTEGLIDKQIDLEDLENASLSGNIETDSHTLNQSMVYLSSASNFHDRNSRKSTYIKGLQTIFEKLYKTQMNLNENYVEDYEIHQQDRDTFKMTLMLGVPHLADKMIRSELDQVLQFNGEYENYVEKKRREKRELAIALQKMTPNTAEFEFTKGKLDNFLILKRDEFFLTNSDESSLSATNSKTNSNSNLFSNLLIDTSNIFRNERIDSTSNFISERERILIEQDQIKLKHPIKLFILFTTNNNQITNASNGTFVNSKFFIKLLSKIGKITGLLPQFGFLHMSLILSSMRFDWLDSELCVPKTKLKSMRAIACIEVGSVETFSDLKKVTKILGTKISFWNRNIHYCRGIGYHYNTSTVEEKVNHQGSCHQFVFDLLDSLSSDITLVSEKPSILGMHDLLKDDLLLGKKGCIGSYLDWCANNLVKDSSHLDNSEWCRIELREPVRKQFAPLLRNKITQLSSQMCIDEEEDDSKEQQLISYNKTLNLILFGNSFVSNQRKRKSRALSIGMIKSPPSPSTPFSEDSPRKKKKSDSVSSGTVVICFPTHSLLDEFVRDMVDVSKDDEKPFNITPEFYLLKSFDRALWLRNNFDKNKICRDLQHSKLPTHEFLVEDNRKRTIQGKDPLTSLDYLDEILYKDEEESALYLIKSLKNEPAKVRNPNNSNVKTNLPTMRCMCPFGDPRRELPFIENASIPTGD